MCDECKGTDVNSAVLYLGSISSTKVCRISTNIPSGYYTTTSPNLFQQCSVTKCRICPNNVCTGCLLNYFIYQTTSCKTVADVQALANTDRIYGINAQIFSPCDSTGCHECFNNYKYCDKCDINNDYYRNLTLASSTCVLKSSFPAGFGVEVPMTPDKIVACVDPLCSECRYDNDFC